MEPRAARRRSAMLPFFIVAATGFRVEIVLGAADPDVSVDGRQVIHPGGTWLGRSFDEWRALGVGQVPASFPRGA